MAVTTASQSFSGGIKPIGEALPINLQWAGQAVGAASSVERNYDFFLDQSYVLTDLEVVKTNAGLPANSSLAVEVLIYPPNAEDNTDLVQVALATLQASAGVGTKAIAGVLTDTLVPGTSRTNGLNTNHFANGSGLNQIQPIYANVPAGANGRSQQRIRVRITGNNADNAQRPLDLSCFILARFAAFSPLKRTGQLEVTTVVG